jgi:hypothetical protein
LQHIAHQKTGYISLEITIHQHEEGFRKRSDLNFEVGSGEVLQEKDVGKCPYCKARSSTTRAE